MIGLPVLFVLCPSGPDFRGQTESVARALNDYREHEGRYPSSLAEAGLVAPTTRCYGDWVYKVTDDGTVYTLTIGNYDKDGFTEQWINGNHRRDY
jgi:hypothetical protein